MRAVVTQVVTKRLGALPVVAEFLHRLRVAETVDGLCPARDLALATHGEVIEALVANRLTSPRPLVRVEDWARTWAVKEVMDLDAGLLNDDRLGRALDAIAPHLDEITGSIAARAICEFGIDTATLHWDMTSMSLTGAFDPEGQDPDYPQVAYGHPKDRRVDLKQIQAGLGVSADGAVPLLAAAISGQTGEITQVVSAIARFQKTAGVKRFLMIGDSKLVSYDNLTALSAAQVEFIAPLAASATDPAVFAALDPEAAERVAYVPLRAADRPTMDRPDYRVLEDTHTLAGKRRSDPPLTVRRILVHSAGNASAQAKARDKRLAKAREDLDKLQPLLPDPRQDLREDRRDRRQATRHRLPAHPHHRRPRPETDPRLALRQGRARPPGQGRRLVRPDHQPGSNRSGCRRDPAGLQGPARRRVSFPRACEVS
jgi:transposase